MGQPQCDLSRHESLTAYIQHSIIVSSSRSDISLKPELPSRIAALVTSYDASGFSLESQTL